MEELRSTAIIDKEILEDARKKAERILANSVEECKAIAEEVLQRIEKVHKEKQALYDKKVASYKRDAESSLPLEKQRYLVAFEEKAVKEALAAYLVALPKTKKLMLLTKLLERYKEHLTDHKVNILAAGFRLKDIKQLVASVLGSDMILDCKDINAVVKSAIEAEFGEAEGMIIETEDKSRRCRVIIGELTAEMIDSYSYELTSTLFGGRLPE